MILAPPDDFVFDIGEGDLYSGRPYSIPYFYETPQVRMMKEPDDPLCISFKSWKGNFYQFYLGKFHAKHCLIITSTLKDCYFIPANCLSLERSAEKYREISEKKHYVEASFSGYFSYGKKVVKQYESLMSHLKNDKMYFSEEVLKDIYSELKRRVKYERSSST